jgi:hypothetical protein
VLGALVGMALGLMAMVALSWIPISIEGATASTPQGLAASTAPANALRD